MDRVSPRDLGAMKRRGHRIAMLTAYDYLTAKILDDVGVPVILVGDSLGTTILGYETTIPVTLDDVIHHARAVTRASRRALVVADMPFMSYHPNPDDALRHAARLLQEGGAHAVKLEGGAVVADTVRRLVDAGIPVQGHLGLTPQSVYQLGGYRVQGRTPTAAQRLLDEARQLQDAGAFSIVLELVPALVARSITETLSVPTIGIGAGPFCDGQVQVITDLLGLDPDFHARHVRRYAAVADVIRDAVNRYVGDVRAGEFPGPAESFGLELADVSVQGPSPDAEGDR
jgi:3-methyl-2-oxobutanoate hydroxymethyltransferase